MVITGSEMDQEFPSLLDCGVQLMLFIIDEM